MITNISEPLKNKAIIARAESVLDRLPPHATESEMAIIGACITTPVESIPEAQATIKKSDFFYDLRCRLLWDLICEMDSSRVDAISVFQKLCDNKTADQIGGIPFLSECQDKSPSSHMMPSWLEIVAEKYLLRRMIKVSSALNSKIYEFEGNPLELLDHVESEILSIRPQQIEDGSIKNLVHCAIDKMEQKCISSGAITGLSTGLPDLDRLTDGMHKGEMITLCALPSRGKTALAVNIAVLNALKGIPVAIFSAEMMPVQLVVRSICSESRVNFKNITAHDVPKMTPAAHRIAKAPLHIVKASGYTIGQVKAVARRLKQKHDIQLIVVDYLQRLSATGQNKEQEQAAISGGIKSLCLELEVPIIALSQVNDKGEAKYARATSEDTDSLWKLENDGEWQHDIQPIFLNVEKCRDGETGAVPLKFLKTITRFESAAKIDQNA